MDKNKTSTSIDTEIQELRIIFRAGIIAENPDMEFQQEQLEKQVDFLMERANNIGNETLSESEIADQAFQIGLHDNNYVNRKVSNKYDFSQQ